MAVETRIDPENANIATFHFSDRNHVAATASVIRGLDSPHGLAHRVISTVRARPGRGAPRPEKILTITWAVQDAIDAFLAE